MVISTVLTDRERQLIEHAVARRDKEWAAELGKVSGALQEAGISQPLTTAAHMREVIELARPTRLPELLTRWLIDRTRILDLFKVPTDTKRLRDDFMKLNIDDRRTAKWKIEEESSSSSSLLYTYEPLEKGEAYFEGDTDYFVDDVHDVFREQGLVLALANLQIGRGDVIVIMDESNEVK